LLVWLLQVFFGISSLWLVWLMPAFHYQFLKVLPVQHFDIGS